MITVCDVLPAIGACRSQVNRHHIRADDPTADRTADRKVAAAMFQTGTSEIVRWVARWSAPGCWRSSVRLPVILGVAAEISNCSADPEVMVIDGVTLDSDQIATYTSALAIRPPQMLELATSPILNLAHVGKWRRQPCDRVGRLPLGVCSACLLELSDYQNEILPLRKTAGNYTIELYRQR